MPVPDDPIVAQRRKAFEAANRDSYGFRRSRKGTYRNPVVARDWKWFQLGVFQRQVEEAEEKAADAKINPPNVNERHPGDTWLGGV